MKTTKRIRRSGIGVVAGAFMLTSSAAAIGNDAEPDSLSPANPGAGPDAQWSRSFALDNDALISDEYDEDYSFGLSFTFRGKGVVDQLASLHQPLDWLDRKIGLDQRARISTNSASIEYGLYAFTPENLSTSEPQRDDRPYASLVYIASSHERYQPTGEVSWKSTLTLGVLGLDMARELHKGWHSLSDSSQPKGWDNQISEGGEPTARYSLARQHLLYRSGSGLEIKTTILGSVGYLTEASWSVSLRAGNIYTPWTSFNPELTSYGEKAIPTDLGRPSEHYFWTGFALKARAYNVFLQGQFRDSEVTYDSDDLNPGIVEAWAGYTYMFDNGYSLAYSMRAQTSDIKRGHGDRNYFWGTLSLTKFFF
jgi:hypothetical protein